jgi:hypothetical protein
MYTSGWSAANSVSTMDIVNPCVQNSMRNSDFAFVACCSGRWRVINDLEHLEAML